MNSDPPEWFDTETLNYIKSSHFNITPTYLSILTAQKTDSTNNGPYYLQKIKEYDDQFKYINLYQEILNLLKEDFSISEVVKRMAKYTNIYKKNITRDDVTLVYNIEFSKKNTNQVDFFKKRLATINNIALKSKNTIKKIKKYDHLTASAIKIIRKTIYISYDSNITPEIIFSYLHTSESIPVIKSKNGRIKIQHTYQGQFDYSGDIQSDILLLGYIDDYEVVFNLYPQRKLFLVDIKAEFEIEKLFSLLEPFKIFHNFKVEKTENYVGSFNLYGFEYNEILFSYALMNLEPYRDLFYINEKDTNLFTHSTSEASLQYHMNSLGQFYDKVVYDSFTKNESIIRFSMNTEQHSTTETVLFPPKNGGNLVEQVPPGLKYIKVNFGRSINLKTVYLLRLYLPRLLKHYLSIEKSISQIYKNYGLNFKSEITTEGTEFHREIIKYKQFAFNDRKDYTRKCPLHRRPKVLNPSEYQLLSKSGVKKESIAEILNKQNQKRYLYCPYTKNPQIIFENGIPCCYTSNYNPKGKIKTTRYQIKPQNIFFDFLELFRPGKYEEINCSISDISNGVLDIEISILKCITLALNLKISSTKLLEQLKPDQDKLSQIEIIYNVNVFILEENNDLKFQKRSIQVNLNNPSVLIVKKVHKTELKIEYIRYNNKVSKFGTDYTAIFNQVYLKQHQSLLVTPTQNIPQIDHKLDYHRYFEKIPVDQKEQIVDFKNNTRVIILKKSRLFQYDIYIAIYPIPTNPLSGKIIPKPEYIMAPPYQYLKRVFPTEAMTQTINNKNQVIALWYHFNGIPNMIYVPIKPERLNLKVPFRTPLYQFGGYSSLLKQYRTQKTEIKNLLILISYFYTISELDLAKFYSFLVVDPKIKQYDLSGLSGVLQPGDHDFKSELKRFEKIVPSLVHSNKIWLRSKEMLAGVKYYLSNFNKNKLYFDSRLSFEFKPSPNELVFDTPSEVLIWQNIAHKYDVQTSLQLLKPKYLSKDPLIYLNNGYYLIQPVRDGSWERALKVAYEWYLNKINLGYDSSEWIYEEIDGKLKIPNHLILNLDPYYQIDLAVVRTDMLLFVNYPSNNFAAILPLK